MDPKACAVIMAMLVSACTGADTTLLIFVEDDSGDIVREAEVWLALTSEERARGLLDYPALNDEQGLLIVMPREVETCINSVDLDYPLDLLFTDAKGQVLDVTQAFAPGTANGPCVPGVKYVLELRALGQSRIAEASSIVAAQGRNLP